MSTPFQMAAHFYAVNPSCTYDPSLIQKAIALTHGRDDGHISLADMKVLWEYAQHSGNPIKSLQQTFSWILEQQPIAEEARDWYQEQSWQVPSFDERMATLIKGRFGLQNLKWDIAENEVIIQNTLRNQQTFEEALTQALSAFLYDLHPLSNMALAQSKIPWHDPIARIHTIHEYLNLEDGDTTLRLIPLDYTYSYNTDFPYTADPNELLSPRDYWTFQIPGTRDFNHDLIAQVRRSGYPQVHAYAVRNNMIDRQHQVIKHIIQNEWRLDNMQWEIDPVEVSRQMALNGEISFVEALRGTLQSLFADDTGGVRSIIGNQLFALKQEAFADPAGYEAYRDQLVRMYLAESVLRLLPLDLEESSNGFQTPENEESVLNNWVFQLEVPRLGDYHFWVVVDRRGSQPPYNYSFN